MRVCVCGVCLAAVCCTLKWFWCYRLLLEQRILKDVSSSLAALQCISPVRWFSDQTSSSREQVTQPAFSTYVHLHSNSSPVLTKVQGYANMQRPCKATNPSIYLERYDSSPLALAFLQLPAHVFSSYLQLIPAWKDRKSSEELQRTPRMVSSFPAIYKLLVNVCRDVEGK